MQENQALNFSICLSDIPENKIKTHPQDGKKYVYLEIRKKQQKDEYGQDHNAAIAQTNKDREDGNKKIFVGNGELYAYKTEKETDTGRTPQALGPDEVLKAYLCLSDIPKEKLNPHKNGKIYLNISIRDAGKPDKFGQDHYIYIRLSKEEAEANKQPGAVKIKPTYIGMGKIHALGERPASVNPAQFEEEEEAIAEAQPKAMPKRVEDDFPF